MFSPIWGKGNGRGISGFAVNRGAVNRGFTVVILVILVISLILLVILLVTAGQIALVVGGQVISYTVSHTTCRLVSSSIEQHCCFNQLKVEYWQDFHSLADFLYIFELSYNAIFNFIGTLYKINCPRRIEVKIEYGVCTILLRLFEISIVKIPIIEIYHN